MVLATMSINRDSNETTKTRCGKNKQAMILYHYFFSSLCNVFIPKKYSCNILHTKTVLSLLFFTLRLKTLKCLAFLRSYVGIAKAHIQLYIIQLVRYCPF